MSQYFEPMLYLSTPEHPNTMCMTVVLKESVDGEVLRGVVGELRTRFPYFYVRAQVRDNDIYPEANPLPMMVRDTWEPIDFNSRESNYHLAAWKFAGTRMAFEVSHSLTDGAGVLPYVESALYLYVSRVSGLSLDPAGFRLPKDAIPESEVGDPFADLDIDAAEEPLYSRQTARDFFRLSDGVGDGENEDSQVHYVRLSERQVMQRCKDHEASPNALMAVILARAARRYEPSNERTVSVSVAIDHKAMLGVSDNYRLFANVVEVDFPKGAPLEDLEKSCAIARGQIIAQAQPENSLWALRQRKELYAKMDQLPLDVKLNAMARASGTARWSFSLSYLAKRTMGPLDSFVDELYMMSEPGVSDVCIGMTCINHSFFLAVSQSFPRDRFVETFLEELSSVGIDCDVVRRERLDMCGMEPFDRS